MSYVPVDLTAAVACAAEVEVTFDDGFSTPKTKIKALYGIILTISLR